MTMIFCRIIFWLLVLTLPVDFCSAQSWEFATEKEGIKVYTRAVPDTDIKAFKAITSYNINIDKIASAIQDFKNYPTWYDHCSKAYLIDKNSDGSLSYYIEVTMPLPLKDRDVVSVMKVDNQIEKIIISFEGAPALLDENEDFIRMKDTEGIWILTKTAQNITQVEHQFMGDPSGYIPSGIINLFIVKGLINTLSQLNEYLVSQE